MNNILKISVMSLLMISSAEGSALISRIIIGSNRHGELGIKTNHPIDSPWKSKTIVYHHDDSQTHIYINPDNHVTVLRKTTDGHETLVGTTTPTFTSGAELWNQR